MRNLLLAIAAFALLTPSSKAQDAITIIDNVRAQFETVNDLRCDVDMQFDIPGVAIDQIKGKMIYKKPDKFRVKTKGLIFLPKQNPFSQLEILSDKSAYMAVAAGSAQSNGIDCHIINVIPTNNGELVLMKLLIGKQDNRIHESELTLKREGTVQYFNTYNSSSDFIPTTMEFKADFKRFKMPKAISGDFSSTPVREEEGQSKYETGKVLMTISNLELNRKISDSEFEKEDS
jgi:outer membrane lipoprotein-sorting protein